MLCKICGEDNTIGSESCWKCHSSLSEKSAEKASPETQKIASAFASAFIAKIWALAFVVAGVIAFQKVAPFFFARPSGGGINFFEVFCAGAVGAASWLIGFKIGKWFNAGPSK